MFILDKIIQSGAFNNQNFQSYSGQLFSIADKIAEKCYDIISTKIRLSTSDENDLKYLNSIFLVEEIDKNNNNKVNKIKILEEQIPLSHKVFFFW